MIQKNKEIEISKDDIFANDKLNRENTIKDLSQLLVSTHEPFVLSINASWGTGKTTFVKLWKYYLEKELDVHSIYFSAWEDDFSKEPLISIMGELNSYITEKFPKDKNLSKKLDELKSASGKIIKRGLPAFIKGATAGVLDIDKGLESAIGAVTESVAKELIDSYDNDKAISIKFKELLHNIIEQIDSEKPLVIFIDELDRCRPLYAIELLERLKHIFGIEKLIFVLSIDKTQLSESIKSQYGNIDTDNYLRRFIDLEYTLQNPSIELFCEYLYEKYELEKSLNSKGLSTKGSRLNYLELMKKLVVIFDLSLRVLEQLFLKINIIFKTIEPNMYEVHLRIFVFFEMLKVYNTDIYYNLINNGDLESNIRENLLKKLKPEEGIKRGFDILIHAIIDSTGKSNSEYVHLIKSKKNEKKLLPKLTSGQRSIDDKNLEWFIYLLEYSPDGWDEHRLNKQIETVIKKLEFIDSFNFGTIE